MKTTTRQGAVALLVLAAALAILAACVQAPAPGTGSGNATITYRFYGGFVMPTHAIQELVVTPDRATFTISGSDGTVTEKYEKAITKEQFDALVAVFADNRFESFGDRYDEGQNYVTDVGFTDITLAANGRSKTVTTYNYDTTLPAGLVAIRAKLQEMVEYTMTLDEAQVRALAEGWIRDAPTYRYDGSGLELVRYTRQESLPVRHVLTYRFTSSHAGYGNRSGTVTAQVMTEHTAEVTVVDGKVESAVIDGKWDERGQFLIGSSVSLSFQPLQCEKTPWQVWEENSGRVYIRAPTDEEIITHYYAAVYETTVREVKKVESGMMTCEACGVCPVSYRYDLTVDAGSMQPLLDEGWRRNT